MGAVLNTRSTFIAHASRRAPLGEHHLETLVVLATMGERQLNDDLIDSHFEIRRAIRYAAGGGGAGRKGGSSGPKKERANVLKKTSRQRGASISLSFSAIQTQCQDELNMFTGKAWCFKREQEEEKHLLYYRRR